MALLYTITLQLSSSISVDLVRFEDQCMRVLSLLSTLGALYSLLISNQKRIDLHNLWHRHPRQAHHHLQPPLTTLQEPGAVPNLIHMYISTLNKWYSLLNQLRDLQHQPQVRVTLQRQQHQLQLVEITYHWVYGYHHPGMDCDQYEYLQVWE